MKVLPPVAFFPVILAAACGPGTDGSSRAAVTVTDSAGVLLITVGPLEDLELPHWAGETMWSTQATGVELYRVSAARVLVDDRVAVGNGGNREILLLDPDGRLATRVGRDGDGPGEFRAITSIHRSRDGFGVFDTRLGRWSYFDGMGALLATTSMMPPDRIVDLLPLVVSPEGAVLGVYGSQRRFARQGIRRDTTPLLHYAGPGAAVDTLSLWPATEWSYTSTQEMAMRTPVGFGRSLAVFGSDELAVLGDTDTLAISVFDVSGTLRMRIIGGGPGRSITDAEGTRWKEGLMAGISPNAPEEMVEAYRSAPLRDSYPAFHQLAVAAEGRVWVGETATIDATRRRWILFSTDGQPEAAVDLPVDAEILDARGNSLLILTRDELGIETLSYHRFVADN